MYGISMQRNVHLEVSPTFYNLDTVSKIKLIIRYYAYLFLMT